MRYFLLNSGYLDVRPLSVGSNWIRERVSLLQVCERSQLPSAPSGHLFSLVENLPAKELDVFPLYRVNIKPQTQRVERNMTLNVCYCCLMSAGCVKKQLFADKLCNG